MSNLDGLNFYGDYTLDDNINYNVISFLRYGFLELGAYTNIPYSGLNYANKDISLLKPLVAQGLTRNTVYRSNKSEWIWERGITLKFASGTLPYHPSGVYVNETLYMSGVGPSGRTFYVDYSRGQIVFNSGLSNSDTVRFPRAERAVSVYATDSSEYRSVLLDWRNNIENTGVSDISEKAYLPCIFSQIKSLKTLKGSQIGSRSKTILANFEFDVIAANSYEAKKITDILYMMEDKAFKLFDINLSPKPLGPNGALINPSSVWPTVTEQYFWGPARWKQDCLITKDPSTKLPIYHNKVRISLELDVVPF